jgi:hydroxypyruvate isomerase
VITWSAHLSMLFTELGPLERPQAARRAGFTHVESWWPGDEADAWAESVLAAGLTGAALNADGGDQAAGERGYLNDPARHGEALEAFAAAAALAGRIGARCVNVLIGRELPGRSRDAQLDDVAAILSQLAGPARSAGLAIVLEPINSVDVPGYLAPTPTDVAALIDRVGRPEVRLLFDAYHAARMGLDPVSEARRLAPVIGHVQFADCPGRGAPGTGTLDIRALVEALAESGYEGALGLEYDPAGPTEPTLGFLRDVPPV